MKSAILFLLPVLLMGAPALAQQRVQAELVADTTAIEAGKPFTVGVHLHIADGWHVYWINPGDSGAATTLKITAPDGFIVGPVQYPVPEKLAQPGGLTVYAYEKDLLLKATVTPPASLDQTTAIPITATVRWCVCSDVCILGKKDLRLDLQAGSGQPANDSLFSAWGPRFPLSADQAFTSVSSHAGSNGDVIVDLNWRNDPPAGQFQWLPGPSDDLTVTPVSIQTTGRSTRVSLNIQPVQGISPTSSTIDGLMGYYVPGQPAKGVMVILQRSPLHLAVAK